MITKKRTSGMTSKIKYLEQWADRHGKERLYYRKGKGERFTLRGPIGSAEFWEDYSNAANGEGKTKPAYARAKEGSLRWLVEQYYRSAAFKEISLGYQKTRRGILDNFCEDHGTKQYAKLEPHHIRKLRDNMLDRPGAANNLLKALRQVYKYAVNYDLMPFNPVAVVEKLKPKNKDGFHAWTADELLQFENTHAIGTKARLAFALLLYTGQRRSDTVRMGRQHVKDGWMTVRQQKTGTVVDIPILEALQSIIDQSPTGDLTYLVTAYDKPFTSNGFGNWFRDRCDEAKLPQCSAHGLRKAAATKLANIGCSTHEIMSITGHSRVSEIERYTKTVHQKRLAESVRKRIDG